MVVVAAVAFVVEDVVFVVVVDMKVVSQVVKCLDWSRHSMRLLPENLDTHMGQVISR